MNYANEIERERRAIERYRNEMNSVSMQLQILTNFSVSSYNLKEQRLMKLYDRFAIAHSQRKKLQCIKNIIKFVTKCSEKSIHFRLDGDAVKNELKHNLRPEYREKLESIRMKSGLHTDDDIIKLCNRYVQLLTNIKDAQDRIRYLQKEEKNEKTGQIQEDFHPSQEPGVIFFDPQSTKEKRSDVSTTTTSESTSAQEKNIPQNVDDDLSVYHKKMKKLIRQDPYLYLSETVDPLIDNYIIAQKIEKASYINAGMNFDPEDVLDFALNTYNMLPQYLEEKHNIQDGPIKDFYTKLGMENSLDKYEKIYNKYMRAYNMMSKSSKEYHNERISSYGKKVQYQSRFGERDFSSPMGCMIKPEDLRMFINKKIIRDMQESSPARLSPYFSSDDTVFATSTPRLQNITQFMDESEIEKLYRAIKEKWDSDNQFSTVPIDQAKIEEGLRTFQNRFVHLLAHRLYNKEEIKLSEEEYSKLVREKYDEICEELLHEKPLHIKSSQSTY